jgi:hypothetical protein
LLLLLPQIVSISRDLIEEAQLAKIFGLANVDELMAELLLPSPNTYSHLKSSVTTPSITLSNSIAASTQQIGNGSELAAIAAARNESLNFSVHNQFPVTMTIIAPRPVYPFNLPSS